MNVEELLENKYLLFKKYSSVKIEETEKNKPYIFHIEKQ